MIELRSINPPLLPLKNLDQRVFPLVDRVWSIGQQGFISSTSSFESPAFKRLPHGIAENIFSAIWGLFLWSSGQACVAKCREFHQISETFVESINLEKMINKVFLSFAAFLGAFSQVFCWMDTAGLLSLGGAREIVQIASYQTSLLVYQVKVFGSLKKIYHLLNSSQALWTRTRICRLTYSFLKLVGTVCFLGWSLLGVVSVHSSVALSSVPLVCGFAFLCLALVVKNSLQKRGGLE